MTKTVGKHPRAQRRVAGESPGGESLRRAARATALHRRGACSQVSGYSVLAIGGNFGLLGLSERHRDGGGDQKFHHGDRWKGEEALAQVSACTHMGMTGRRNPAAHTVKEKRRKIAAVASPPPFSTHELLFLDQEPKAMGGAEQHLAGAQFLRHTRQQFPTGGPPHKACCGRGRNSTYVECVRVVCRGRGS